MPFVYDFSLNENTLPRVKRETAVGSVTDTHTGVRLDSRGRLCFRLPAAERERIAKELEKAKNGLRITEGKLANEKFVAHAPENVVNAEREKVAKYQELIAKLEESAKAMA